MKKQYARAHISLAVVFLTIGILAFFFAPTHDDLINLSCRGFKEAFENSLMFGNGRFLGGTFVKMFLHNKGVDIVLRALFIGGIVVLSAIFVAGYSADAILITYFMYLGVGLPIFRQVFVWGHGFYNYVPPVFLLLVCLCLLKWYNRIEHNTGNGIILLILFTISFAAQFFAENSTTINVLIMLFMLLWVIAKKKRTAGAIAAIVGAGIGALTMFLAPTILGVADNMDEYRDVILTGVGLVENAVKNMVIILNTLSASVGLWLSLSVLIFILAKQQQIQLHWFLKAVLIGFLPTSIVQNYITNPGINRAVDALFVIYILCAGVALVKLLNKTRLISIGIGLGVAIVSVAQLLVVNPIGSRCLLITYSMLVLSVLSVFCQTQKADKIGTLFYKKGLITLSSIVYAVLLVVYVQSWKIHCVRMDYAWEQLNDGKKQIEIVEIPHTNFFHRPNESYVYPYTFNHGNRDEMRFSYITYEEYVKEQGNSSVP